MAGTYKKIPITAGQILGNPSSVAISRKANILAVTIALTSGVMLQAFRITPTGLTPIVVNGQLAATRSPVSVSPNGTYIVVGSTAVNQPRFEIWKYNTATGQYDKMLSGPTDSVRYTAAVEWLSEDVFIRGGRYAIGSTYRGSTTVYRIVGTAANMLFERLDSSGYGVLDIAVSRDADNFMTFFNGALSITDSFYWDGSTVTFVGRTNVGAQYGEYLSATNEVLGSRGGANSGVKIYGINGDDETEILGAITQDLGISPASGLRLIYDGVFFVNHAGGTTFFQRGATTYDVIAAPNGLNEIGGLVSWKWSRFSNALMIAGIAPSGNDLRVFMFEPEPVSGNMVAQGIIGDAFARMQKKESATLIDAGPMGNAWVTSVSNETVRLSDIGPMGDAILRLAMPESTNLLAIAPMGDATLRTIGQHFINLAIAPMGDAALVIENVSFDFLAVAPMGDATLVTVEFDNVEFADTGPMGDATITFTPQWSYLEAVAPMGDATFVIPNVYVNGIQAIAPMGDASVVIPNVYVRRLFAQGLMGDARAIITGAVSDLLAVGPMGDASFDIPNVYFDALDAQGPMGDASFDIPNVYFDALDARGLMGDATVEINVPPTGSLVATGIMGDAAVGLHDVDFVCRRRNMIIIQVF